MGDSTKPKTVERPRASIILLLCATAAVLGLSSQPVHGLDPSSPSVRAAIGKGVAFLETEEGVERRVGGKALVGLALLKAGKSPTHPRIQEAAAGIRKELAKSKVHFPKLYTPGIALMFLVELESGEYTPEIRKLLAYIEAVQKPHGGWGYPEKPTGDTSMTQYVVLGLWEASRSGFDVSPQVIERGLIWLLKVRDPSGGFGYQGVVSDSFKPVPQTRVMHGVSLAGLSSVYACADLLGFYKSEESDNLPPGLAKVDSSFKCSVDRSLVNATAAAGAGWIENHFSPKIDHWPYYYLYTLERYFSFRKHAEGGNPKRLANWYDLCANHLLQVQADDGSWCDPGPGGERSKACDTAWGVLFLLRSMKKSIERARHFGAAVLVGGRGLPKDSDLVKIKDGAVVNAAEASEVRKLLEGIEERDDEEYTKVIGTLSDLPPDEVKALVSQEADKLRQLAGGTSANHRLAAVQALSSAGTLSDVPTLIYALTDPEPEVVLAARGGLRRISRKVHGFKMPDDFDEKDRLLAINRWKKWFLAIRPDAEFE